MTFRLIPGGKPARTAADNDNAQALPSGRAGDFILGVARLLAKHAARLHPAPANDGAAEPGGNVGQV